MMMQHTKDLHSWQLEQDQELDAMKKLDAAQDVRVANHLLGKGMLMDVKTLEGCLGVTKSKVKFVIDWQTKDQYLWENMINGHQLMTGEDDHIQGLP